MIDKWVFNAGQNALINSDHIRLMRIEPPTLKQKDYIVVAELTYGTEIVYRGTADDCKDYIDKFRRMA